MNFYIWIAIFIVGFGSGYKLENYHNKAVQNDVLTNQVEIERLQHASINADFKRSTDAQNASNNPLAKNALAVENVVAVPVAASRADPTVGTSS